MRGCVITLVAFICLYLSLQCYVFSEFYMLRFKIGLIIFRISSLFVRYKLIFTLSHLQVKGYLMNKPRGPDGVSTGYAQYTLGNSAMCFNVFLIHPFTSRAYCCCTHLLNHGHIWTNFKWRYSAAVGPNGKECATHSAISIFTCGAHRCCRRITFLQGHAAPVSRWW